MRATKTAVVCVVIAACGLGYLYALATHPDYNPFVVLQEFRDLRKITTLKSLIGEIRDCHEGGTDYPRGMAELLEVVANKKPQLASAVAGIDFKYHSDGESYFLYWRAAKPSSLRNEMLAVDGECFYSLERFVEKELLPEYETEGAMVLGTGESGSLMARGQGCPSVLD